MAAIVAHSPGPDLSPEQSEEFRPNSRTSPKARPRWRLVD